MKINFKPFSYDISFYQEFFRRTELKKKNKKKLKT